MVCGSGLKAVMLAAQAIRAGDANLVVAGGMESMSRAPFLLQGVRQGYKYGDQKTVDALIHDGLWCPFENWAMGEAAEHIATKCGVSRADQDRFAAQSHQRAAAAWAAGAFADEIVPVTIPASGKKPSPAGASATRASGPTRRPRGWRSCGPRSEPRRHRDGRQRLATLRRGGGGGRRVRAVRGAASERSRWRESWPTR